jgi:hypothetical protein
MFDMDEAIFARTSGTGEGLLAKVKFKKGNLIFTCEGVLKKGRYPYCVGDGVVTNRKMSIDRSAQK